jgi:hypothetical protein
MSAPCCWVTTALKASSSPDRSFETIKSSVFVEQGALPTIDTLPDDSAR